MHKSKAEVHEEYSESTDSQSVLSTINDTPPKSSTNVLIKNIQILERKQN